MNSESAMSGLLLIVLLLTQFQGSAQDVPGYTLPDDPGEAWTEVMNLHRDLRRRPDHWRATQPSPEELAEFEQEVRRKANAFFDKGLEFIKRFRTSVHLGDALQYVLDALGRAAAAGDRDAVGRIQSFIDMVLADETILEDWRVIAFLAAGSAMDKQEVGMRLFTFTDSGEALREELSSENIKHAREALKRFPTNASLLESLLGIAERSTGKQQLELVTQILNTQDTPAGAKTVARHILSGTKPYEVGKPIDIRFTALDGLEVDLAQMKAKVVLVKFWSSSSIRPAAVSRVKHIYETYRDRGFEVIGIALDQNVAELRQVIVQHDLPWPQHFDGKGLENQFAVRYGIFHVPTMWLLDKRGNLRDVHSWSALERRVIELLAEPDSGPR